jgi:retinol dehydrogenase-12
MQRFALLTQHSRSKIHVVFCSAGIMIIAGEAQQQKTAQGHEIQFGTNVLGHHLLVKLLKPTLIETASQSESDTVRIIFTSSFAHYLIPNKMIKNWDLSDEAAKLYNPDALYGRSKMGNIHQASVLAKELDSKGIIVASCHPGLIQSNLLQHAPSWQARLGNMLTWPVYYGSISQLYLGTAKAEHDVLQNAYYAPWGRKIEPYPAARDAALAEKTWQWCEENSKGF